MAAVEKNRTPTASGIGGQGAKGKQNQAGPSDGTNGGDNDKSTRGLEVSSTQDGYRRAGRSWTKEPVIVPLCELSDEQIAQLEWDINIRVVEVDLPPAVEAQ